MLGPLAHCRHKQLTKAVAPPTEAVFDRTPGICPTGVKELVIMRDCCTSPEPELHRNFHGARDAGCAR